MMQDLSGIVRGVTCAVQAASLVVVLLASWSRLRLVKRKLSLHNLTMLIAWLLALGMSASIVYATCNGFGRHDADLSELEQARITTAIYVASIFYQLGLMAQKTGLLFLLYSVIAIGSVTRAFTVAIIAVVNAGGIALTLLSVFRCHPISAAWSEVSSASCIDILTIYLASAPLNIATDVAIFLLPLPSLWSLHLPKRQKAALLLTFGCGLFVTVIDVVRIVYLEQGLGGGLPSVSDAQILVSRTSSNDFSYYASLSFLWSAVEINLGIICACVPSLKPLLSRQARAPSARRTSDFVTGNLVIPDEELDVNIAAPTPASPGIPLKRTSSKPEVLATIELASPCFSPVSPSAPDLVFPSRCASPRRSTFHRFVSVGSGSPSDVTRQDRIDRITSGGSSLPPRRTAVARWGPFVAMAGLFLVWGCEYGLLAVLNQQFQSVAHFTSAQTTLLNSLYYVGYILGPPSLAYHVLQRRYFKQCCLAGLGIFACGALVFWPATVLQLYPLYALCNIILGFGLSNLEIAADTYMVLAGSPRHAASRLAFSQGVQAVGTLVASAILESTVAGSKSLLDFQWLYLGLALLSMSIAVGYSLVQLPTPDIGRNNTPAFTLLPRFARSCHRPSRRTLLLAVGILAMICYVGAQEVNSTSTQPFFAVMGSQSTLFRNESVVHALFALSRFIAAGLAIWLSPRFLLIIFWVATLLLQILCMTGGFSDSTMAALFILLMFAEGPLFPFIFAETINLRDRNQVFVATLLTSAIGVGGSVFPPIAQSIRDGGFAGQTHHSLQTSFAVAVAALALGCMFPAWLNCLALPRQSNQIRDQD